MNYKSVIISSGHGKIVRGASGILDEVDEARRLVEAVAQNLRARRAQVETFHDDVSTSQSENLERIVDYHNSRSRELDISVHFNAYTETEKPMGTEVLYQSQSTLAGQMSGAIAKAGGFVNRGGKKRADLYFLNETDGPAILIETCFVDSQADADLYRTRFGAICEAIAWVLKHEEVSPVLSGKASWFGGPEDEGVAPDEGLAFYESVEDAPALFLEEQPPGTSGLARRLNPEKPYIACRWDYSRTPKEMLPGMSVRVRAVKTGKEAVATPADWGPHEDTGRVADISPGLMEQLGIQTDDEVEITILS